MVFASALVLVTLVAATLDSFLFLPETALLALAPSATAAAGRAGAMVFCKDEQEPRIR